MTSYRIETHPILDADSTADTISFTWCGQPLTARPGEMLASALFAHGIRVFGHHHKDGAPLGIFCANGQCGQCMVLADGKPVKACMTPVTPGLRVEPVDALPALPNIVTPPETATIKTIHTPVLILGGGPAGLSAAIELGEQGIGAILVDDKARLGGKLVLQTHRFFGSAEAVYAGTRGIDIATKLAQQVGEQLTIDIWLNSTAVGVFSDKKMGILRSNQDGSSRYVLVEPEVLLVATGAREKSLVFPGNTLPGVYGAGAFQTLVNRDLVRAAERLFIVGGGNVGLIAGYHALQAGIHVVGLVEALPECGGYKVHEDKLRRLGIPIYTSHTVLSANGNEQVKSITIAEIDRAFAPVPGTAKTFPCDTILIAVGLNPVNEFTHQARAFGMTVFDAGDAQAIAEASAAMFSGKIAGRQVARALGKDIVTPESWAITAEILRSHPGATLERELPNYEGKAFPVFHCRQEIPCNPCTAVCPRDLIYIPGDDIRHLPEFRGEIEGKGCIGCERCVAVCPGLAITLVDARRDPEQPTVSIPYEFASGKLAAGDKVVILDTEGQELTEAPIKEIRTLPRFDHTVIVRVTVPKAIAAQAAGLRAISTWNEAPVPEPLERLEDDAIVCRCERVTAGEIRARIRAGCRDVNELKTMTRAGMGACGGKTCTALIDRLFREEGIPPESVRAGTSRPLFVEVALGTLADSGIGEETV